MPTINSVKRFACLPMLFILLFFADVAAAQSEFAPWGNIMGIRQHGQLFDFETSIKIISGNGLHVSATAKEMQRPNYTRNGSEQIVTTNIDSLFFKETVYDRSGGKIAITVQLKSRKDTVLRAVYFRIILPRKDYTDYELQLIKSDADSIKAASAGMYYAKGINLVAEHREMDIRFNETTRFMIDNKTVPDSIVLYIPLARGILHKGDSLQKTFIIKVSGYIDKTPVRVAVDTSKQGRPFEGFGGNFRIQNPKLDPQVIDYSLSNLRVAWGRVEMPWRFWQPQKDTLPSDTGKLHPAVMHAMEMAQKLGKMNIPVILTAWAPPAWAIIGKPHYRPVNGVWGNPLNWDNEAAIYQSITTYILYLKAHYGVDVKLFSFNESDLGINIRVTPEEHDRLIKGLGAYFAAHGLQTKMLLGDNSDATTYSFVYPALNDPDALQYIGAISFHSWRGWTTEILQKWAESAKKGNLPLIVGEGSIDAQAFGYPQIFQEPTYALQEINLYTRILNICQPLTILQWQLTADYSPLIGGGIFGNNEPLHPGQRFWNLKQLASTPQGLFAMPVSSSATDVSCAALGDNSKGIYTIHLVNNNATRQVSLTGLPTGIKVLHLYVTNKKEHMKEDHAEKVGNGTITFKMEATSYYTLVCTKR
jgi:hypothetical protein